MERGVMVDLMGLLRIGLGVASGREVAVSSSAARLTRLAGPASRLPRDEGRGRDVDEDDEDGRSSSALEGERLRAEGLSVPSGRLSLARKAEGWSAIESIFLKAFMCTSLKRLTFPAGVAILRPKTSLADGWPFWAACISIRIFAASPRVSSIKARAWGLRFKVGRWKVKLKSGALSMMFCGALGVLVGVCWLVLLLLKPSHLASSRGLAVLIWYF